MFHESVVRQPCRIGLIFHQSQFNIYLQRVQEVGAYIVLALVLKR
jgi:sporulation protein YlmC with PRC-barrel domain